MKTTGIAILVLIGVALVFWAMSLASKHPSERKQLSAIHSEHRLPAPLSSEAGNEAPSSPAADEVTFFAINVTGAPIGNVIVTEAESGSSLGSTSQSGTLAVPRSELPYDHLGRFGVAVSHDDYATKLIYL